MFEKIKQRYAFKKEQKINMEKQSLIRKKNDIIEYIKTPMPKEKIHNYNVNLIADSAGWVGGSYTEKDLKMNLLFSNRTLFESDEYNELIKFIVENSDTTFKMFSNIQNI